MNKKVSRSGRVTGEPRVRTKSIPDKSASSPRTYKKRTPSSDSDKPYITKKSYSGKSDGPREGFSSAPRSNSRFSKDKTEGYEPRKRFNSENESGEKPKFTRPGERGAFKPRSDRYASSDRNEERPKRTYTKRGDGPDSREDRPKREGEDKPYRSNRASDGGEYKKKSYGDGPKRSYTKNYEGEGSDSNRTPRTYTKRTDGPDSRDERPRREGDDKPYRSNRTSDGGEYKRKSYGEGPKRSYTKRTDGPDSRDERPKREGDDKPYRSNRTSEDGEYKRKSYGEGPKRSYTKKYERDSSDKDRTSRPFTKRGDNPDLRRERPAARDGEERPYRTNRSAEGGEYKRKTYGEGPQRSYGKSTGFERRDSDRGYEKKLKPRPGQKSDGRPTLAEQGLIRLNKFIANAGICSRREADDLIASGNVTVNGKVVTELGHTVNKGDEIKFNGQLLHSGELAYLLLNKPKDTITTMEDPDGRKTVLDLLKGVTSLRVFPVGRLDRNTTGLLLFTNDGELAQRLTHPKYNVRKIYYAELDANFRPDDLDTLRNGVELEDGFIKPDQVEYAEGMPKNCVGIEIHSGRNRIIHRMFESLGYKVNKLDRTFYAGLTKKDLSRGAFRHLAPNEVKALKNLTGMK